MIFAHTIDKVLSGEKTQTRRLIKPGESLHYAPNDVHNEVMAFAPNRTGFHRVKWAIGNTYSVQPARGMKGVARIRVTNIRREDVRNISHEDAIAEGFVSKAPFLELWAKIHDEPASRYLYCDMSFAGYHSAGAEITYEGYAAWFKYLQDRPAERYQAWVLEFKLVETS